MKPLSVARLAACILVVAGISWPVCSVADDDARDYIAAPPGTFLMITYYKHIFGHTLRSDGDAVSKEFNLVQDIAIFRPVYYTKLGPFVIDPQCLIIAGNAHLDGDLDGDGVPNDGDLSASGFADPVVLATIWLVNNPETQTWFGVTPFITVPIGDYDHDKTLNMGGNRWTFKPEIGFVKGFGNGLYLDFIASYEMFQDNDDFGPSSVTLEQDPVLVLEGHVSYDVTKTWYVALDYYYKTGGETTIDGVDQDNRLNNHALQGTLGFAIGDHYQLLLQYRDDFRVEEGPETNTFGVRFLYAF